MIIEAYDVTTKIRYNFRYHLDKGLANSINKSPWHINPYKQVITYGSIISRELYFRYLNKK